jgi:hypothetical protein
MKFFREKSARQVIFCVKSRRKLLKRLDSRKQTTLDFVAPDLVFAAPDLDFVVLGFDSITGDLETGALAESTRSQRKRVTADC